MTPEKLRRAQLLEKEIYALEKAATIPINLQNNPDIIINRETPHAILIPRSVNKKIFALLKEELEIKKKEFEEL